MRRENFLSEFVFLDHNFKVNIDVFATGEVIGFLLFFLAFGLFHFQPTFLPFLLYLFDFFERVKAFPFFFHSVLKLLICKKYLNSSS